MADNHLNIEAERAEFEAWASSENWIIDKDSFGEYIYSKACDGWETWKTARRTPVADGAAVDLPELNELPRPAVTYADHSYPAFSKKQMADYAEQYARKAISHYLRKQAGQVAK